MVEYMESEAVRRNRYPVKDLAMNSAAEEARKRRRSTGGVKLGLGPAAAAASSIDAPNGDLLDFSVHSFVGNGTISAGEGQLSGNTTGMTLQGIKQSVQEAIKLDAAAAAEERPARAPVQRQQSTSMPPRRGRKNRAPTPLKDRGTSPIEVSSSTSSSASKSPARRQQQRRRQAARRRNSDVSDQNGAVSRAVPKSPRTRRSRSPRATSTVSSGASTSHTGTGSPSNKSPAHKQQRRRSFAPPVASEETRSFSFQVIAASCCSTPQVRRKSIGSGIMLQTQSASQAQQHLHYPLRRQTRRMTMQQNPTCAIRDSAAAPAPAPVNALHEKCRLLFQQDNQVGPKKKDPPRESQSWESDPDFDALYNTVDKKTKYRAMLSQKDRPKPHVVEEDGDDDEDDQEKDRNAARNPNPSTANAATTSSDSNAALLRKAARERCRSEKRRPSAPLSSSALSQIASFNSLAAPRKRETPTVTIETSTTMDEDNDPSTVSDDEDFYVEEEGSKIESEAMATETSATPLAEAVADTVEEKNCQHKTADEGQPKHRPATKLKKKPASSPSNKISSDGASSKKKATVKKKRSSYSASSSEAKSATKNAPALTIARATEKGSTNLTSDKVKVVDPDTLRAAEPSRLKMTRRTSKTAGNKPKAGGTTGSGVKKPKGSFLAEVAAAMNSSRVMSEATSSTSCGKVTPSTKLVKKKRRTSKNTETPTGSASANASTTHSLNGMHRGSSSSAAESSASTSPSTGQPLREPYGGANPQTPSYSSGSDRSSHEW